MRDGMRYDRALRWLSPRELRDIAWKPGTTAALHRRSLRPGAGDPQELDSL